MFTNRDPLASLLLIINEVLVVVSVFLCNTLAIVLIIPWSKKSIVISGWNILTHMSMMIIGSRVCSNKSLFEKTMKGMYISLDPFTVRYRCHPVEVKNCHLTGSIL